MTINGMTLDYSIIGEIILIIFIIGREYQINRIKNKKVEVHSNLLEEMKKNYENISLKVKEIESESSSHGENIKEFRIALNALTNSTNERFEKSEKNQSVQLMLMSQICEKLGVNLDMAKYLMN